MLHAYSLGAPVVEALYDLSHSCNILMRTFLKLLGKMKLKDEVTLVQKD